MKEHKRWQSSWITWIGSFVSIVLLVVSVVMALQAGEVDARGRGSTTPPPSGDQTIYLKKEHSWTTVDCDDDNSRIWWHFVITGVTDPEGNDSNRLPPAPRTITVVFSEAGLQVVPLARVTGNAAQYEVYTDSPETLENAWTTIRSDWRGNFNLSLPDNPCIQGTVTPTEETTVTPTEETTVTPTEETTVTPTEETTVTPTEETTVTTTEETTVTPTEETTVTPTAVTTPVGTPEPTPTATPSTPTLTPPATPPRTPPATPPSTPVSEAAGATATPTPVSEALPATATPPTTPAALPQVLPKTGSGTGDGLLIGLLTVLGVMFVAIGTTLELRRRSATR